MSLSLPARHPSGVEHATPHSEKFRVAIACLLGIAIAAIGVAVVIAVQGSKRGSATAWSPWSPTDTGKLGATEIAEHVAPLYRQGFSSQLDVITLVNLANPNAAGTTSGSGLQVAVNSGASSSSSSSSSLSLLGGTTIAYNLCGVGGTNCGLPGTPSATRLLLLRREALELALYTFKYISTADNVVAVLPPGRTTMSSTLTSKPPSASAPASSQPVTIAVLFVRQELQPWLSQPLSSTLSEFPPEPSQLPLWSKTEEAGLVDEITGHGLFSEKVESEQTGGNLLVLSSLPPQ